MKRRGFTIWECLLACMVLTVLTAVCLKYFGAEAGLRRQVFEQLAATQEAANLMERLQPLAWDELTTQAAAGLALSPQARKMLPEGRFEVKVDEASGTPAARRVAVEVFWRPQPGEPEREARVVAWRYQGR